VLRAVQVTQDDQAEDAESAYLSIAKQLPSKVSPPHAFVVRNMHTDLDVAELVHCVLLPIGLNVALTRGATEQEAAAAVDTDGEGVGAGFGSLAGGESHAIDEAAGRYNSN
jgi:hypothetical protein